MTLKSCRACGHSPVASDAAQCPNRGKKDPAIFWTFPKRFVVALPIVVIAGMYLLHEATTNPFWVNIGRQLQR